MAENDTTGATPGTNPGKGNSGWSAWSVAGGLFLALYGGEVLRLGTQVADLFAAGVEYSASQLYAFLGGYWANRAAIQRRAAVDAGIWLGMLVLAASMGSIGMSMGVSGPADMGKLIGGAIMAVSAAYIAFRLNTLVRARIAAPDWNAFFAAYPWAARIRDIICGPVAFIVVGPAVGLVVWALMPSDPLAFRTVASNAARVVAVMGTLYAAFRLAGALALVNVAAYWATATVSLVQEPLGWIFKVVQGLLVKAGAVEIQNGVPRIVDTAKVGEVLKSIQLNLVMVFLLISALTIAAPSITLLGAIVTIMILIAAYVANAGAAGLVIEFGYKIIAKVILLYISSTAITALLKFWLPDSFGWLLYAPGYADARLYAVLDHGVVQSAVDLWDGVWAAEAKGLLPSGEVTATAVQHAMSVADRISVGLVYAGMVAFAITVFLLKLAILRAKFQKKGVASAAATTDATGAAEPTGSGKPSWLWSALGGLAAIALVAALGYGGYRAWKSVGSSSTGTGSAPAATATVASVPTAPPATATATGGRLPPPPRVVRHTPPKTPGTTASGGDCSRYPSSSHAYERCVELASVRAANRYSDEQ